MTDYLIVGLGLAGISFCEQLERNGHSFMVISDYSQPSSAIAGGLYNPVVLKRFTPVWKAAELLGIALPFYGGLEKKLGVKLDYRSPVLRRLASISEQNFWFQAADNPALKPFLSPGLSKHRNSRIDAPYGYGEVLGTGRIATDRLLTSYGDYLLSKGRLRRETFLYPAIRLAKDHISYNSLKARRVIFATGFGMKRNPWFNYLPLTGAKGEFLTIRAPGLKESHIIRSNIFCIPWGGDLYRIGATYRWEDKTNTPTGAAKAELIAKLERWLKCEFTVVGHEAGIRPTVTDRRPLVGRHPEADPMYVLNGLGSRGVMTAPFAARQLYEFIASGKPLLPELDIARFQEKYYTGLPPG